jgi:hypothetical protein
MNEKIYFDTKTFCHFYVDFIQIHLFFTIVNKIKVFFNQITEKYNSFIHFENIIIIIIIIERFNAYLTNKSY